MELKSRLMLLREEDELLDLEPGKAADELFARMLEARRYRRAAETWPAGWPTRTAIASARAAAARAAARHL